MQTLYSFTLWLCLPIVLLYFFWRSRKDPAYRHRLTERFGRGLAKYGFSTGGIVVHAVSVGEVIAAIPLIQQLQQRYPSLPITVTCTTPTGTATLRQRLGQSVQHCYLPLDYTLAVRRFLKILQPRLLIIMETELWPNLLAQCERQSIPVVIVNARLSARSAKGYRRVAALSRPILQHIRLLLTQDAASARRFRALGYQGTLAVTGNLKFELAIPTSTAALVERFRASLANRLVWVAASTHAGEDEQLLSLYPHLKQQFPNLLLLLVPRHPERFEQVAELVQQAKLTLWRRSSDTELDANVDIALGDSMGELLAWYQLADLVFIGGSLIPRGGHNPLEAICFAKAVQTGPHIFNFKEAYRQLQQQDAVCLVHNTQELMTQTQVLLAAPHQRHALGQRAHAFFAQQQGATTRTLAAIAAILTPSGVVPMTPEQHQQGADTFWFDQQYFSQIDQQHFDAAWWQQQNAVIGSSSGRNTAYFVQHGQHRLVLRHYYRGGLIGKLLHDQFWWQAPNDSRAMQEYQLLAWMRQQGLAVPRPVAAHYQRSGLIYRASLLIELIPNSKDVATILQDQALSQAQWQAIGAAIAKLHAAGVYHSDLNCRNIMLDHTDTVWLIDFDKCERRPAGAWAADNLARLQRSLSKEHVKLQPFYWQEQDWDALVQGYQQQQNAGQN